MPKREQEAVVEKLLQDEGFREDLIDIAIVEERREEPSRLLAECLAKKKEKQRLGRR